MSEKRMPKVGDVVVYHDEEGKPKNALINAVWGISCVNLVFVSSDAAMKDTYGRQIGRETSVDHVSVVTVHGRYFRWPDEQPRTYIPPVES